MKVTKQIAMLCAGCLAFAGMTPVFPAETAVFAAETEKPMSGTCGADLRWTYDKETKTLTISGTGDMDDYFDGEDAATRPGSVLPLSPWRTFKQEMEHIVLEDGITGIGQCAFGATDYYAGYLTPVTEITIPGTVKKIGHNAFSTLQYIKAVTIPASVEEIGYMAFANCEILESVTILNPDCKIYQDYETFSSRTLRYFPGVIRGFADSTAQAYAEKYHCRFEAITDASAAAADNTIVIAADKKYAQCGIKSNVYALHIHNAVSPINLEASLSFAATPYVFGNHEGFMYSIMPYIKEHVKTFFDSDTFYTESNYETIEQHFSLKNAEIQDGVVIDYLVPIPKDAAPGIYPVKLTVEKLTDADGNEIPFKAYDGFLEVVEKLPNEENLNAPEKILQRGDPTGNGILSIEDAQLTLKAYTKSIAGKDSGLTAAQIKAADVNLDGKVSVEDAQLILRFYTDRNVSGRKITWDDLLK